jgi:hypothetical protein
MNSGGVTFAACAEHDLIMLSPALAIPATSKHVMHVYRFDLLPHQEVAEGTATVISVCGYVILPFAILIQVSLLFDLLVHPLLSGWLRTRLHNLF